MRAMIGAVLLLWCAALVAAVSAVDSSGRQMTLAAPAQRIVSLAPHITELLYAAGAGDKLVAVSEFSDYPAAAKRLPLVGSSAGVDLERILALRADLIVAWRLAATAPALDRLASLGIPVFYSEPRRLDDIPIAIEDLGALAGTDAAARGESARLRAQLAHLRTTYAIRAPISVFYAISERPLMTLNGQHLVSDALALCGGRNVFVDAPSIAPVVDTEAVLAADPQVIIAARSGPIDDSWREFWARFPALRAVRDQNLWTIQAEALHRNGPRAIAATARLCALLDDARRKAGVTAANRP
jgi:iron complex transport system substrate-binding protein